MTENREKIDALLIQPGCYPKKVQIGTELEDLQGAVGGYIEIVYPFSDPVGIILNEEGKLLDLPPNRAVRDAGGDLYDIYCGDFLVVGLTEDTICSLTGEQMKEYEARFHQPEVFLRMGKRMLAVPMPDEQVAAAAERRIKQQAQDQRKPSVSHPEI